jgi:hypothetical protein
MAEERLLIDVGCAELEVTFAGDATDDKPDPARWTEDLRKRVTS